MKCFKQFLLAFTVFSLFVSGSLVAQTDGKVFAVVDRVDYGDSGKAELVLDDQYYLMALNLKVHDKKGTTTMYAIKQGEKIYYTLDNDKVNEVWILPQNTPRPDETDD